MFLWWVCKDYPLLTNNITSLSVMIIVVVDILHVGSTALYSVYQHVCVYLLHKAISLAACFPLISISTHLKCWCCSTWQAFLHFSIGCVSYPWQTSTVIYLSALTAEAGARVGWPSREGGGQDDQSASVHAQECAPGVVEKPLCLAISETRWPSSPGHSCEF